MKWNSLHIMTVGAIVLVMASVLVTAFFFTHSFTPTYQTISLSPRAVEEMVEMNGTIVSAKNVDLSFDRSGRVARVPVVVGQLVKAGQELVTLEHTIESGQLAQAQASLDARLAGSSSADLAVYQAAVDAAYADLQKTKADTDTTKTDAITSTEYAYQNAEMALHAVSVKLDEAINVEDALFLTNREFTDKYVSILDSTKFSDAQAALETAKASRDRLKGLWQKQGDTQDHGFVDAMGSSSVHALADVSVSLDRLSNFLASIPLMSEFTQAKLDAQKIIVNAARASVNAQSVSFINAQQMIVKAKSVQHAQTDVQGSAQSLIVVKQAVYDQSLAVLKSKQSPPREVDVAPLRAAVEMASGVLQKTILRAPVDGVVARQDAKVGVIATPGAALVSVVNPNTLQIEGNVSERDVVKVHVGNSVSVSTDAYGTGMNFPATVVAVDQSATGSGYKVVVQLNGVDDRLKSGMQSAVRIQTRSKSSVLAVPSQSITVKNGKSFVHVVRTDHLAHETEIQTGIVSVDGYTETLSGLQPNDAVVTFGN